MIVACASCKVVSVGAAGLACPACRELDVDANECRLVETLLTLRAFERRLTDDGPDEDWHADADVVDVVNPILAALLEYEYARAWPRDVAQESQWHQCRALDALLVAIAGAQKSGKLAAEHKPIVTELRILALAEGKALRAVAGGGKMSARERQAIELSEDQKAEMLRDAGNLTKEAFAAKWDSLDVLELREYLRAKGANLTVEEARAVLPPESRAVLEASDARLAKERRVGVASLIVDSLAAGQALAAGTVKEFFSHAAIAAELFPGVGLGFGVLSIAENVWRKSRDEDARNALEAVVVDETRCILDLDEADRLRMIRDAAELTARQFSAKWGGPVDWPMVTAMKTELERRVEHARRRRNRAIGAGLQVAIGIAVVAGTGGTAGIVLAVVGLGIAVAKVVDGTVLRRRERRVRAPERELAAEHVLDALLRGSSPAARLVMNLGIATSAAEARCLDFSDAYVRARRVVADFFAPA